MLEITVDIVPYGCEGLRRNLNTVRIINDGMHPERPERGSYSCTYDQGSVSVKDHVRDEGYFSLLKKCIDKIVEKEK